MQSDAALPMTIGARPHRIDEMVDIARQLADFLSQFDRFFATLNHKAHAFMNQVPYGRDLLIMLVEPLLNRQCQCRCLVCYNCTSSP